MDAGAWLPVHGIRASTGGTGADAGCRQARSGAAPALTALEDLVDAMHDQVTDFEAYRQTDVRLHVGLAQVAGSPRLITATTL